MLSTAARAVPALTRRTAAVWHAHVTVTDLASVVPNLAASAALNAALLARRGGKVTAGTLDFLDPEHLSLHNVSPQCGEGNVVCSPPPCRARVILAADVIYSEELPAGLATTILTWLEKSRDARAMLCGPLRVAQLEWIREVWERLEGGGLEAVEEGRVEQTGEEWDDEKLVEWSVWAWRGR